MKNGRTVFIGIILSGYAFAADLALTDGRVLKDYTITSQTPRTVFVRHFSGLSSVPKAILPPELQARYPIDEAAALEADRKAVEASETARKLRAAEKERKALSKSAGGILPDKENAPASPSLGRNGNEIKLSAKRLAESYFEKEYSWSPGESHSCSVQIEKIQPVNGWTDRWHLVGIAVIDRFREPAVVLSEEQKKKLTAKQIQQAENSANILGRTIQRFEGDYSGDGPAISISLR